MTSALDKVLAKMGKTRTEMAQKRGSVGQVFRRAGVSDSAELRRIIRLPRRRWEDGVGDESIEETIEVLTQALKKPRGTQRLWAQQAAVLAELHYFNGVAAPIRTTGGKTLMSLLAPAVVEVDRALLLVPGALKTITQHKKTKLSEHWNIPNVYIESYNFLSREENAEWLDEFRPGMIIADECQALKNLQAACTKRVHWWMNDNEECIFLPLSGTFTNRSLHEFAHLLKWSLKSRCPVPRDYGSAVEWGLCIDENKTDGNSLGPGKLSLLYNDEEAAMSKRAPLVAVRRAFQRRLCETPGVVSASDVGVTIPLKIRSFDLPIDLPDVDEAYRHVRKRWETPCGQPFCEAVKVWSFCRQLACGFYYIWSTEPPKMWLKRRQDYSRSIRHIIAHNNRRLATEFQVCKAIRAGLYDCPEYWAWVEIRDTFVPDNIPVWVHDEAIVHAAEWLEANPRGICWTEHKAFGNRLSEETGIPYFGAKGLDAKGRMIEHVEGPVIASVRSNGTGRDLQFNWDKNLIMSCAPNGEVFEQLLARTHREGQRAPEVTCDLYMGCSEFYYGFQQALKDTEYAATVLNQSRKLLRAELEIPSVETVAALASNGRIRWQIGIKQN